MTSGKKAKQKRKQEKIDADVKKAEKKVLLLRIYDTVFPGKYTQSQDKKHLIVMCSILLGISIVIGGCLAYSSWLNERSVSDQLTVPSEMVAGQENNAEITLSQYGFRNIYKDADGNVVAFGTPEMVQAYKDSFSDRSLKLSRAILEKGDFSDSPYVSEVKVSDDLSEITVVITDADVLSTSTGMKMALSDTNAEKVVNDYVIWAKMQNDGKAPKITFVGKDGDEYYSTNKTSVNGIIAEKEADERSASTQTQDEQS